MIASLQERDHEAARYGRAPAGAPKPAVPAATPAPPKILWHDVDQPDRKLVEIRASDRTGLLAVLTAVFIALGLNGEFGLREGWVLIGAIILYVMWLAWSATRPRAAGDCQ